MKFADIVQLGASVIAKSGAALWQGVTRLSSDPNDVEPLGEGDVFQGLGLTSMPYPADENGYAEAVCLKGVGGRDTIFVGARDTRSAKIVGKAKPGDTILHSTGPEQAAQVQLKEKERQAALVTKDPNGKTMMVLVDGKNNKIQFVLAGCIFELDGNTKTGSWKMGDDAILLGGGSCALDSSVILGGTNPDPVNKIVTSPAVGPAPLPCATGPSVVGLPIAAGKGVSLSL